MHRPRTDKPLRSLRAALASAVALAALLMLAAAPAVEAKVKFKVPGRGYGHGVGMSQWGAYGFAKQGKGAKRILSHYYRGTKLQKLGSDPGVRVLLSVRGRDVRFSNSKRACGERLNRSKVYRATLRGSKVRLHKDSGRRIARCGKELVAKGAGPVQIGDEGTFRGKLVARASGEGLYVINDVGLDDYIKGVVPNESPASWPAAALKAQAVAARSYALATDAGGAGFDQYDDTRSQVYVGKSTEQPTTNRAVRRTAGKVLRYDGEVIPAYFSSSSGGQTENVEFGFGGGTPRPYLKSVRDPYDKASPYHRWTETFSRREMQSRLGDLVAGRLRRIKVTKTGVSPRIVEAKVIGSAGRRTATGAELRSRLGLRSTWAKFKRVKR